MKHLHNQVAVITGGGAGIGAALAVELARQGCRIAVADLDGERAAATANTCSTLGKPARAYAVDVADREAMTAFVDQVVADFGRVNLVINNAGVYLVSEAKDMSWASFDWLMSINFWGVMHGSQLFLPHLIASGNGHLVNISSIAGMVGFPYSSAYNAAKFAVRGYTESLAQEMALEKLPVQVTCVHPGCIQTDIFKVSRSDSPHRKNDAMAMFEAMASVTPEQAAQAIVAGILNDRNRILIGHDARFLDGLQRLVGVRYQKLNQLMTRYFNHRNA